LSAIGAHAALSLTPGSVWQALSEPWGNEIVVRAMAEAALIGVAGGALGCWIVLYGLSYGAESLAHAMFPGLALAALTGMPLLAGAAAGLAAAAVAIPLAGRAPQIGGDTAVGIVVTALFGGGIVLALSAATPPAIGGLLFGDILAVSDLDLVLAALCAVTVPAALRLLHGQLLVVGFDRANARSFGGRPLLADGVLLALTAAATLVAVPGLGNLLVVAILVGPAATARLVTGTMPAMMVVAVCVAVACGAAGLYLSYYAGLAGGASIALAAVCAYLLAAAWSGLRPRLGAAARRGEPGSGALGPIL
jgi:ABC-type Mn2+/Zn2+ transport system permease subunit